VTGSPPPAGASNSSCCSSRPVILNASVRARARVPVRQARPAAPPSPAPPCGRDAPSAPDASNCASCRSCGPSCVANTSARIPTTESHRPGPSTIRASWHYTPLHPPSGAPISALPASCQAIRPKTLGCAWKATRKKITPPETAEVRLAADIARACDLWPWGWALACRANLSSLLRRHD
jgi:hypothetical protein